MATSEGIPSSIDIEFLELNDNPYLVQLILCVVIWIFVLLLVNMGLKEVDEDTPATVQQ